jgi:hypothetical protein
MSIDQRRANLTRLRARAEEEGWSDGELDDLIRQEANLVKEELGLASSEPSIMRHAHLQRHFSEFRTNQVKRFSETYLNRTPGPKLDQCSQMHHDTFNLN